MAAPIVRHYRYLCHSRPLLLALPFRFPYLSTLYVVGLGISQVSCSDYNLKLVPLAASESYSKASTRQASDGPQVRPRITNRSHVANCDPHAEDRCIPRQPRRREQSPCSRQLHVRELCPSRSYRDPRRLSTCHIGYGSRQGGARSPHRFACARHDTGGRHGRDDVSGRIGWGWGPPGGGPALTRDAEVCSVRRCDAHAG